MYVLFENVNVDFVAVRLPMRFSYEFSVGAPNAVLLKLINIFHQHEKVLGDADSKQRVIYLHYTNKLMSIPPLPYNNIL